MRNLLEADMRAIMAAVVAIGASGGAMAELPSIAVESLRDTAGQCQADSHTADGLASEDLAKKQSRIFCNSMLTSLVDEQPGHMLITFSNKGSARAAMIGFGGFMQADGMLAIQNLYFGSEKIPATEGFCKFFYKARHLNDVVCGGYAETEGHKSVAVVNFHIQ